MAATPARQPKASKSATAGAGTTRKAGRTGKASPVRNALRKAADSGIHPAEPRTGGAPQGAASPASTARAARGRTRRD